MAKHPIRQSLAGRAVAMAKRNPIATVAAAVAILAGIPGAVAGANYLTSVAEPWTPAFIPDVTVVRDGKKIPVIVLAQQHATDIDFLIIKEQYRALAIAKEDLKRDPDSVSAKKEIEHLNQSIQQRQQRLDKATGGR